MLVLLSGALLGASSGLAAPAATPNPLVLRFTLITKMLKSSKGCSEGAVLVQGHSRTGAVAKARLCLLRTNKIRAKTKAIISRATITVAGLSGTLRSLVRIVEVTKGSVAHRTITGVIYPGTGDFAKAGGRVFGKGTITFPKKGRPRADLSFTFGFD